MQYNFNIDDDYTTHYYSNERDRLYFVSNLQGNHN